MPSGAGTNLKVRAPVRNESMGAPIRAGKIFLVVPLHFFCSKSTISRFDERFFDGQYSLVSFFILFAVLLHTVPPVPHGVGATDCALKGITIQTYIFT